MSQIEKHSKIATGLRKGGKPQPKPIKDQSQLDIF
jgi:hypothetical protein